MTFPDQDFAHHRLTDELNSAAAHSEKPVIVGVIHLKAHVPSEEEGHATSFTG